jgi:hypothetical protein
VSQDEISTLVAVLDGASIFNDDAVSSRPHVGWFCAWIDAHKTREVGAIYGGLQDEVAVWTECRTEEWILSYRVDMARTKSEQ